MPTKVHAVLPPVSRSYPPLLGRLPTRYSPVRCSCTPEGALPLNLHVLGTPPAFILSQDQTLQLKANDRHAKGTTFVSNKELIAIRFFQLSIFRRLAKQGNGGPSGTRSSFQRAFARFGPHIVEPTRALVKRRTSTHPLEQGSATIRNQIAPVNPRMQIFFPGSTAHQPEKEKGKRGEGSKARKACLGWNSRQDGGRLAERSGNPSPWGTDSGTELR